MFPHFGRDRYEKDTFRGAGNCYLLPLDTVPLITYAKGYYSMTDMAKSTAFLQVAMVILCALWLPLIGAWMGIG